MVAYLTRIAVIALLLAGGPVAGHAQSESLEGLKREVLQLQQAGRYQEASFVAQRALALAEGTLGSDHPQVGESLNDLAFLYAELGGYGDAEPLYMRSLAIREKALGPDHVDVAESLNNLGGLRWKQGRHGDAVMLLQRSLRILENAPGADHERVASLVNNLGVLYNDMGRLADAEAFHKRSLLMREKALGPEHLDVAESLNNLALLYRNQGRYAQATTLLTQSLTIAERGLGSEHPTVGRILNSVAGLYQLQSRFRDAEPLYKRALVIREKTFGLDHPDVAQSVNNLAWLYSAQGRYVEAEPLYKRALATWEKTLGNEHTEVATALSNLALLYDEQGRYAEAELLQRRALAISEKVRPADHPDIALRLHNLAGLLFDSGQQSLAEQFYHRALAIREMALGPEHPDVGQSLHSLAGFHEKQGRYAQAELLYKRAFAISEKALGTDHPDVAIRLNNLAMLYGSQGRYAEAEPLLKRAVSIKEKALGPDHPDMGVTLSNLGELYFSQRDWGRAADFWRLSTDVIVRRARRGSDELGQALTGKFSREAARNRNLFWALAKAVYRLASERDTADAGLADEMFKITQWIVASEASVSVAQMAARQTKSGGTLARFARERQNLVEEWQAKDKELITARSEPTARRNVQTETLLFDRLAAIDAHIAQIDKMLMSDFPDYATLTRSEPLGVADVQTLLRADEALLLVLDTPELKPTPEESFIWLVTKTDMRWVRSELGSKALVERVAALRCGLDASNWDDASTWPWEAVLDQERVREQKARRERCRHLLSLEVSESDWPPFDLSKAHELYQALFASVADAIKGKHLIVVSSGALTSLPFHVLVTEKPDPALTGMAAYQQAAWLALRQPVTVLPSVASLQALRRLGPSKAGEPYLAFGNPLLLGASGNDRRAWDKQRCLQQPAPTLLAGKRGSGRGGVTLSAINLGHLRTREPLPETADELCAVADALGVAGSESDTVWLGERATERNLKALSRDGKLARFKVVHFATHGLLSGESSAILKARAEPALILTPPQDAATAAELEDDNGLLTASEVVQLELDADWVVLSACNTAAGEKGNAEPLTGLARAFFYANARALLVSHWAVNSEAAVKLTTKTFAELRANPSIGRAEALRRSMAALIKTGEPHEAHPAVWGPFALVGEGGSSSIVTSPPAPPAIKGPARAKAKTGGQKGGDWKSTIWRDSGP